MVKGVGNAMRRRMGKTKVLEISGADYVFNAHPRVDLSTYRAVAAANRWLDKKRR
jgi:hypothetical protein